jgi:hypothetical protein
LQALEVEAEGLAARLAETSATTSLGQLRELTERYAELLTGIGDAEDEWLRNIRKQLHASSA